ncbi:hypothetical protein F5X98DRAFT_371528 [Xylaria grammica]|nr:hypothetical protein F5X98DRAFT_371528 [Xylaria grammica]
MSENDPRSQSPTNNGSFQDIEKRKVKSDKLMALLTRKFGAGGYEIYTVHDVYSIRAPEKLSQDEIESCK